MPKAQNILIFMKNATTLSLWGTKGTEYYEYSFSNILKEYLGYKASKFFS